ncbi:hypothetical protein [Acrocarpospora macrocephala]|uniref:hypothetical protein n=1 Tax=Acrocarpospora macrocephala TaxID=150177 RepID=UPI003CD0A298
MILDADLAGRNGARPAGRDEAVILRVGENDVELAAMEPGPEAGVKLEVGRFAWCPSHVPQ